MSCILDFRICFSDFSPTAIIWYLLFSSLSKHFSVKTIIFFFVKISLKVTGTSMIIMCKFFLPLKMFLHSWKKIGSHFKEGAGCVVSRSRTLWSFMTWKFSMQEKALYFRKLSFHDTIVKKRRRKKIVLCPIYAI